LSQLHRKLKIVHTEASLGWGGQEIRVIVELREMARRGHETILVAPPSSDIFHRALDMQIRTVPLSMRRFDFFHNVRWLTEFLKDEKVDVINTHSSRDSWLVGFAGRKAKVPLVIKTRHISARISRGWLTRLVYQKLHDYIITTSQSIADDMIHYNGFTVDHISAVPTGVDLSHFNLHQPALGLRKELGLPADSRLIGMVSVLRSWKGHPDFLQAAIQIKREFPSSYFIIVGEGPRRMHIEQEMLQEDLEEFIFLIGYRDEVPQILRELDVFVLPSYANEGVPQALLQAMAMERPVVATSVGGIPEVVKSGTNGILCEPHDPRSLAAGILRLLRNPAEAHKMALDGHDRVVTEFSLARMAERLEEIYFRMLKEKPPVIDEAPTTSALNQEQPPRAKGVEA
jgi:glycosyltransferase involved in cell wall biosynthesis